MPKRGNQSPTRKYILPYKKSKGAAAIKLYNQSGRAAIPWQKQLTRDIMAVGIDGLWVHQKFGFSVPRRNGKNEIVAMRELWGLQNGEVMCHTAHRTTTSHTAWVRLCRILTDTGHVELGRPKKDEPTPEKSFRLTKQYGLESITLTNGGSIVFRTRTPNGGLGEGFDLLVIDEAQEYTDAQETALIYTVSDSRNPQTIFIGTPPTPVSSGTVFLKMRNDTLAGKSYDTGWAEWSIEQQTDDIFNTDLWYLTNPSMGYHLDERKIRSEIRSDKLDFNIQRLGVWLQYNQKSAISQGEWSALTCEALPGLSGRLFAGVKYGRDGTNAALSIAVRTADDRILVECLDCRPVRDGNDWILGFLNKAALEKTVVDGASGQELLEKSMKELGLKKPVLPTVKEIIVANAAFEQGIQSKKLCHMGQPSLARAAANCEKRPIGSSGGFGYKSLLADVEIALLDSAILAYWACLEAKPLQKQRKSY